MGRDRAAYMRDYRARQRAATDGREMEILLRTGTAVHDALKPDIDRANRRIVELEAEVARLKRELAGRPAPALGTFSTRPFRPVPKTARVPR